MYLLERHCNPWSVIKEQELRLSCDKFVCNLKLEKEPVHEISNNVTFGHVKTWMSLCSLLLTLEIPNGVQSVA